MCENKGRNKKKTHFIFLIILFSFISLQTNQYFLQTKEKNETNETLVERNIDYKEDKASTKYDKKFYYREQKYKDSAQNFFDMKNLADFKFSFNPFQKHSKRKIKQKFK